MNPQLNSALTSVLLVVFTNLGTVLVARGYIGKADVATLAAAGVTLALYAGGTLIGWYKARQVAPAALIAAVNKGDNGVKVVAVSTDAPAVDKPLK